MKRALVTGGGGGLGSAMCRRLARQGFSVIVHANERRARAEHVVEQIRVEGGQAEAVAFDVTDFDDCGRALAKLLEPGPIQVVVNNAGTHSDAPLAGMGLEQWRNVIDVSLNGFFNVTRSLLMPMIRSRWGRIISVSSVSGVMGNRGQSNYAAAKSGLHGATKSLALELATRGITVNAVAPGIIAAGMAASVPENIVKAMVPMQRSGTAEEVAAAVAFLASEEAGYITGQVISVNGGMV